MEYKRIESLQKWLVLKQMIKDKGYHVGFMKDDKRLEVITHSKDVADDIENNL